MGKEEQKSLDVPVKMTKKDFRDAVLRLKGVRQREKRMLTKKKKREELEIIGYLMQQKGAQKFELSAFSQAKNRKEDVHEEEAKGGY